MSKRTIITLSILACLAYIWPFLLSFKSSHRKPISLITDTPSVSTKNPSPFFAEEFIGFAPEGGIVHVGSMCELSDGRVAASWYSGSRVGAKDVAIYLTVSDLSKGTPWDKPRMIVNREIASKELNRYVKKVGNSIIFTDSEERLWLIYTTITIGGWACSSLNVKVSIDRGITWTQSERLCLNPFLNFSALVRNKPLHMKGRRILLPIYHEFLGKFPETLHIIEDRPDQSCIWKKVRMGRKRDYIQPAAIPVDSNSVAAFLRSCLEDRAIAMTITEDRGLSWSQPVALDLPNPNSGLDVLRLPNKEILIAFNDSRHDRDNLRLAVSSDEGATWTRIATIENTFGERYSYPYMILARDGNVHLLYTWRNERMKHVQFNEAWIAQKKKEALQ